MSIVEQGTNSRGTLAVTVLSPENMEHCVSVLRFVEGGTKTVVEDVNIIRLNECYRFYDVWVNPTDLALYINDPTSLVFNINLSLLVHSFRFFSLVELKSLCRSHGMKHNQKTKGMLVAEMSSHVCLPRCAGLVYVFKSLPRQRRQVFKMFGENDTRFQFSYIPPAPKERPVAVPRNNKDQNPVSVPQEIQLADGTGQVTPDNHTSRPVASQEVVEASHDHLKPLNKEMKASVIKEWQKEMSLSNQRLVVCAACAAQVAVNQSQYVLGDDIDLTLLRNDCLPPRSLPTTYNFNLYKRAILHPRGLEDCNTMGRIRLCLQCHKSLSNSVMPKFALSNWLYYGLDELPIDARDAFREASVFDKMLVCRARANTITCRFNTREDAAGDPKSDSILNRSRKGVRGNVLVAPLDVVQMNNAIPPCTSSIRDTMCAVFIGKVIPTRETLRYYTPILVRKSRVKKMIEFLLQYNSHYKPCDAFQYSETNLDSIFGEDTGDRLPYGVHVGYMPGNEAIESTVADYTPRNEDENVDGEEFDELLIENVGYTDGDHSPLAYLSMKALALERCLQGKPFLASGTGPQIIPDFKNPSILTWLFPHLDPWGIGGFYHPARPINVSMFDQLCHLLRVYRSPFQQDPEFAFVFHNVCRKAMVAQSLRFTVSRNVYRKVAIDLLNIDPDVLVRLNEECRKDPYYRAQEGEEIKIFKMLGNLRTVSKNLPGSDGYKIMLRNEIRGLINYRGTPTLFITINPSDVDHPLVRLLSGHDVQLDGISQGEELSKWQRSLLAAKNPSACAKFFDIMINQFVETVLRYGRDDEGVYGKCTAYYGTVEAQGKGTLHCHMLVWLQGHQSPRELRELMARSDEYRDKVLAWMESVISCEFTGSLGVDQQLRDFPRRILSKETGDPHPGVVPPPCIADYTSLTDFWRDYDHFVGRVLHQFAWHEHQATCWKYLERGQTKTDENCRMGMDGVTHETSIFDPTTNEIILRRHHPKIAPHTDVVSFLMQCNMDIKFVGSGEAAKAFLYYVTDYITKASLSVHVGMAALSYAVKKIYKKVPGGLSGLSDDEAKGAVITAVNSMMGRQEISQPQVMSYLVGGGDHYKSHRFVVLQWGSIKKHVGESVQPGGIPDGGGSELTETTQMSSIADHSGEFDGSVTLTLGPKSVTVSSQYLDYIYRPVDPRFNDLCLYDFVSWTSKSSYSKSDERPARESAGTFSDVAHPQYLTHYLGLRRRCQVPVILGPSIPNPDRSDAIKEDWSKDMLLLFKPWRTLEELKGVGGMTWLELFTDYECNLSPFHRKIIRNMHALAECSDARDRHRDRTRTSKPPIEEMDINVDTAIECDQSGDGCVARDSMEEDDALDHFRALEYIESQEDREHVTDAILDRVSSGLLDMCLPLKMEDITKSSGLTSVGVSVVAEDDLPRLAQHSAIMQSKRKRRHPESHEDVVGDGRTTTATESDRPIAKRAVLRHSRCVAEIQRVLERMVAERVIDDMGLRGNDRQLKAFNMIARKLIAGGDDQLLMHVAGVGGTGKSHVIKAVVSLFERLGKRHKLLLGAPTGIAAVLINGQTLHSLISLTPGKQTNVRTNIGQLVATWKHVTFLIVDEVSMIGARFLSLLSNRVRQGKGDNFMDRHKPFGGVNVIFMGDFGQLKPPRQYALYANELVKSPSFAESRNDKGIGAMDGVFLWRQVQNVVELEKNQRHLEDPVYAAFLNRLRIGECITNDGRGGSDLEYLRTRLLERQVSDVSVVESFRDAPIIVGSKSLRDLLNVKLVKYHARRAGTDPVLYFSRDFVNRALAGPQTQTRLWGLSSSLNREAFGRLPLFVGMKVMVTENLAFGDGVVNGSEGYVRDIKYEEDWEGRRYAKVVYVYIEGCGVAIEGLEVNVVPIFPVTTRIDHGISDLRLKSKAFSRRQVPLVPAYVYTDYKSQGRTLDRVIVDLATARGQGVYVMLSRVKTLSGLLILRWFSPNKIYQRLSEELRVELNRIHEMALNTPDVNI